MRLAMYVRVSSESQLDGFGLAAQESACRKWAKVAGHKIVRVCKDEGLSGTLGLADRPGLSCALGAVSEHAADGILVARLDRVARKLTVQEAILAQCWKLGGQMFTADAGEVVEDDPDDPLRTLLRQIIGGVGEFDRGSISKRLRDGRKAKAATGKKAVGDYAYGYRGEGKGRDRDAVPDAAEQVAVARIVELRNAGQSFRQIASALDDQGLKPRRAASWSAMAVRNVCVRELASS